MAQSGTELKAIGMANGYRSIDGSGNNLFDPKLGQAGTKLLRKTPADYGDGISLLAGSSRPMAREVSNGIFDQADSVPNTAGASDFLWIWGQFLDHDISLTPSSESDADKSPMPVPLGDIMFDPTRSGNATIDFTRSTYDSETGTGADNPREQVNVITTYIDASNVYGSDAARQTALRANDGKLLTSHGDLLPYNIDGLPNAHSTSARMFLAGDERANENVALISMHTLFVREHNRLVDELKFKNPTWNAETLFQEAKRIVEAQIQSITYNEFLPKLLGDDALDQYDGYKFDITPEIANVFSTAAFRLGHTMLSSTVHRTEEDGTESPFGDLELLNAFFRPDRISSEGGIDAILRGASTSLAEEIDTKIIDDVRNFLFGPPGAGGFDLAALNIERGRDHGLDDYNTVREAYGLKKVTSFAEITADAVVQQQLEAIFGSVDDIDVFVGGLAEDPKSGSMLGELFHTALVDQFIRLRDGDAFWFESRMKFDEVIELNNTTLSDIIERNSNVETMQDDVFSAMDRIAGTDDADVLVTGGKASFLIGGIGHDVLIGGDAASELHGGEGNDKLFSLEEADLLVGGAGDDQLHGGDSDDFLDGGAGNDLLNAGNQGDTLDGGEGDDYLVTGTGADRVAYSIGNDVVEDFDVKKDVVDFTNYTGVAHESDLTLKSFATGTLISDPSGNSLWLAGVTKAEDIEFQFGGDRHEYQADERQVAVGSMGDDHFVDAAGTQYMFGNGGHDTVFIQAKLSDFTIAKTIDGTGYVMWNDETFDIYWDIETLCFQDQDLQLEEEEEL